MHNVQCIMYRLNMMIITTGIIYHNGSLTTGSLLVVIDYYTRYIMLPAHVSYDCWHWYWSYDNTAVKHRPLMHQPARVCSRVCSTRQSYRSIINIRSLGPKGIAPCNVALACHFYALLLLSLSKKVITSGCRLGVDEPLVARIRKI